MCKQLLMSGKCSVHLHVVSSCLMQRWAAGQHALEAVARVPVLPPPRPGLSNAVVPPGGNPQDVRPASNSDKPAQPSPGVATADAAVRERAHAAKPAQVDLIGRTAAGPGRAGKLVAGDARGDKDGLAAGLRWVSPWF